MILDFCLGLRHMSKFETFNYKECIYYYSGVIWTYGKKSGKETIEYLSNFYDKNGKIPFNYLFGAFHLIIKKSSGEVIMFTDNSNMHCFYISEDAIGTNFLEVIRVTKKVEMDSDALVEFLSLGNIYFGKTFISSIKLSEHNKVYVFDKKKLNIIDKEINGIDEKSEIKNMNEYFENMAYSLSNLNLTLSLTGGYDSRLVFACLRKYIPIDVFISGDNENEKDIVISKKIASITENNFEHIKSKKPEVTIKYLNELFAYAQGIVPFVNDGFFRISNFIRNRAKRYDCYLSGDGGVMHKDWWWLQDLPFYKRKTIDIEKFYYQRIKFADMHIPWGDLIRESANYLDERMINKLKDFKKTLNTQTYDALYFHVNGKKTSVNYNIHSDQIKSYAPLWELELVRYSYNLPRLKRFYYLSMRTIITKASKTIARIPTVYGTTASSEPLFIIRDLFFQGIDYCKKAIRMLGRIFLNKNFFVGKLLTWSTEDKIRELELTNKAVKSLIKKGILDESTDANKLSFTVLGRILQIYLLDDYINKENEE